MIHEFITQYEQLEAKLYWYQVRRWIVKLMISKFKVGQHDEERISLLDIGCGSGMDLKYFARSFNCTGVEPDPTLADKARKNAGVDIYQKGLPSDFPSLRGRFDCVLLLDVLEHIKDDGASLRSVRQLLGKDGKVIINVPAFPQLWSALDEANEHERRYGKQQLLDLIEQAGLEPLYIRYWASLVFPFMYVQRRVLWRSMKAREYRTYVPSPLINNAMRSLLKTEFRLTENIPMPWGVSLLAVAGKK